MAGYADYSSLGQVIAPTPVIGASDPASSYLQQKPMETNFDSAAPKVDAGFQTPGIGFNTDTLKLAVGGIGTITSIWNAFQAQKLARDTFEYNKNVTDTNLANSIQSYNTTLEDRIRSRTRVEGGTDQSANDYINRNRLSRAQ